MSSRAGDGRPPPREGGSANPSRLRTLNEPRPVRVRTDTGGRPTGVALPDSVRRGFHTVEAVRESWRIDDEWWRRPISRLYHDVILEDGRLVTLYRDLAEDRWYEQR